MKLARVKIAKQDIIQAFHEHELKVFRRKELEQILAEHRSFWRLAQSTTLDQFISFLISDTKLRKIEFNFPYRKETRYTWGEQSIYSILMTLKPKCYLTHYTAMFLHNLTDQIPKAIYLNAEQPPKPQNRSDLAQERIDIAFKRPQRLTTNITNYKGQRIWFLNGMHTNQLGVIESEGPSGENIRLTDIERTLIDITVRPYYSGGVYEVLGAFRRAKEHDKVSVNRISAMLSKLNYVYPYHQAIGFYLEKTGVYEDSAIDLLRKAPRQFDFYLTHGTTETEYSKSWKLYYPKGL